MNKFAKVGIVAILAATALAGCGNSKKDEGKTASTKCQIKVGFVTDTGGIDDKSFNQGSWEGIERFAKDNKIDKSCIKYLQSDGEANYEPNLSQLADEKMDLVVAAGYLFDNAMDSVAKKYPDTNFFVIDTVVNDKNVLSGMFAAEQSSYLAGVAAALQAKAEGGDTIGFIGGEESELIKTFQAGYEQGAKATDKNIKIMVDYAGAFNKPDVGKTLADKQYNAGAKVIYHAAGATGSGMISETKERAEKGQKVWAIGVDRDQYKDGFYKDKDGKEASCILTSALKRVDVATYDVSKMVLDKKFQGGKTMTFDIKNEGVGFPAKNPNLSSDIQKKLDQVVKDMKDGKIKVTTTTTIKNGKVG